MWEDISTSELQTELQTLFGSNPCLRNDPTLRAKISPFLTAPVESDAEQASAKDVICDLFGLVTQKRDLGRSTLEEGVQFQRDVEVSRNPFSPPSSSKNSLSNPSPTVANLLFTFPSSSSSPPCRSASNPSRENTNNSSMLDSDRGGTGKTLWR